MLITPTANSSTISAQQQPMHQAPCSIAHPNGAAGAVVPVVHDEAERRAAAAKAGALERGQLVDAGKGDRGARDLRSRPVPGEERRVDRANEAEEPEREQAVGGPRDQVARHEERRRNAGPAGRLLRDLREEHHHRRRRGQHHRGHHRHPDAEVPAERAEVGSRAGIHAPHARQDEHPRHEVTPTRTVKTPGRNVRRASVVSDELIACEYPRFAERAGKCPRATSQRSTEKPCVSSTRPSAGSSSPRSSRASPSTAQPSRCVVGGASPGAGRARHPRPARRALGAS